MTDKRKGMNGSNDHAYILRTYAVCQRSCSHFAEMFKGFQGMLPGQVLIMERHNPCLPRMKALINADFS